MTRPSPRPTVSPAGRTPVLASLESLEARRLLTHALGTATIHPTEPRLLVEGTRRADAISVGLNTITGQVDVVINGGAVQSFNPAQISAGIRISSYKGNDTITVGEGIALPIEIFADKGNDTINGSSAAETIDGGAGRDSCSGGGGDDVITGGPGNDVITGGAGRDRIDGGNGRDSCDGGADNDSVSGGNGRDSVLGAAGDDHLRGDGGRDRCDGGDGDDDIEGGAGRDDLRGGSGTDDFNDEPDDGSHRRRRGRSDNVEDREAGEHEDDDNIPASEVPAAVMEAFNARYPSVTIREIEREFEDEGVLIQIDFIRDGHRFRARFTESGQFVSEEAK